MFKEMFSKQLAEKREMHIYLEKGDIPVNDTLTRLKLKYLYYKSSYLLEGFRKE
jgi:hypothetical protein